MRVDEFAERFWERDWVHVSDAGRPGYPGLLDLAKLDELVAFHRHPTIPPFSLAENGPIEPQTAAVTPRDAATALRAGKTIFVGAVHERWAPAARMCSKLTAELRHPVGCTLVVSPPGAQGLRSHFDAADVLVLQLAGRKTWRIGRPQRELPLQGDPLAASAELADDTVDVEVAESDLLYVPRGFPHIAVTPADSHSVHLSVYVDAVRWKDVLSKALDVAAERAVDLREGVPLQALAAPGEPLLADALMARAEQLVASMDAREVLAKVAEDVVRQMPALPDGELIAAAAGDALTPSSLVRRRDGAVCMVREGADHAAIDFPSASVAGPPFIAPALRHAAANTSFRVSDLPGDFSDDSKVVLVRRLVREGLLTQVVEGDGGASDDSRPLAGQAATRESAG
jgi:hypothetical protein